MSVIHGKSSGTKRRELQIQLEVIARAKKIPVEDSKQNICGINKHTLLYRVVIKKRLRIRSEAFFCL